MKEIEEEIDFNKFRLLVIPIHLKAINSLFKFIFFLINWYKS